MLMLAGQPGAIFLGQNVKYDGNVMFKHLDGVPNSQRLELPVAEELQMGMSIGLALQGFLPISMYPRMDFLLLAMNQLVNHLDKMPLMSRNQFRPKIIIRTKVGSKTPLNAGPQHTQNHTDAFLKLLTAVQVEYIATPEYIPLVYERAVHNTGSTLIVEHLD
jgi:pyruvate/2-oxoglutarate/acetoin dehydrogenase E1 component